MFDTIRQRASMKVFFAVLNFLAILSSHASQPLRLDDIDPLERKSILASISVSPQITDKLYQVAKDTVDTLDEFSIPYMACYGTVLDLKRHVIEIDGRKVAGIKKHDDDIDLAVDLRDSYKIKALEPVFKQLGYKLIYDAKLSRFIVESLDTIEVVLGSGRSVSYKGFVDLFVFKEEGDFFKLAETEARDVPALRRGEFKKEEFLNREVHHFVGLFLPAPKESESYLKRKYGPKCLEEAYFASSHLSPNHKQPYVWTLTEEEKIPNLPTNALISRFIELKDEEMVQRIKHNIYWNHFYATHHGLNKPSSFAKFVRKHYMKKGKKFLEFGCGNGRDAFYFAKKGFSVVAVDFSKDAIQLNQAHAKEIHKNPPEFRVIDVTRPDQLASLDQSKFIYARFFLHSLTDKQREPLMDFFASRKSGTKLFLEFRTDKDPLLQRSHPRISDHEGYADGHYRCFINMEKFIKKLKRRGYDILFQEEKNNLSIVEKDGYIDNPFLARIVARMKKD